MKQMRIWVRGVALVWMALGMAGSVASAAKPDTDGEIVVTDTLLASMVQPLLPPGYRVRALLPPDECPGHYDVKLSDIERLHRARFFIGSRGLPILEKLGDTGSRGVIIDTGKRNPMVPKVYLQCLATVATEMQKKFPERGEWIRVHEQAYARKISAEATRFGAKLKADLGNNTTCVASEMQRQPLEWMGLKVTAEYGRPETLSARRIAGVIAQAKRSHARLVVDNLQSGPRAGVGIAEALRVPRITLSNFPAADGYLATLARNADRVRRAVKGARRDARD